MTIRSIAFALLALALVIAVMMLLGPRPTGPENSVTGPGLPGSSGTIPSTDGTSAESASAPAPDGDAASGAGADAFEDTDGWYDPDSRTSGGLREPKVEMRLPIIDPASQPPISEQIEKTREIVSRLNIPAYVDPAPHPLDQSNQVITTGDGPRGPNPIEPDPNAPGPAGVIPVDAEADTTDVASGDVAPRRFDPGGPQVEVPEDLAALPGPGQGVFDPDNPGPDETRPRSSE